MAEKLVSAGVFTSENDVSYLPQGISAIGAAIIGPTSQGPAFIPTLVESPNDFIRMFGDAYEGSYVPYTVKEYLKNAGRATIVRVAGISGYTSDAIGLQVNGTLNATGSIFGLALTNTGIAYTSQSQGVWKWSIGAMDTTSTDFTLSSGSQLHRVSLNQLSSSYIGTVLGSTVGGNGTSASAYLYVSSSNTTALNNILSLTNLSASYTPTSIVRNLSLVPSGTLTLSGSTTLNSTLKTYCVLAPASSTTDVSTWSITGQNSSSLSFILSSSVANEPSYSVSLDPGNANYVLNVFGSTPENKKFYVYNNWINKQNDLKSSAVYSATTQPGLIIGSTLFDTTTANTGILANGGYSEAWTPWVKSQTIDGQKFPLFKFWTFTAGPSLVKISISDIKRPDEIAGYVSGSTYGTFTVTIRDTTDTDIRPNALESYGGVTLDPVSPNYIGRVIGDQYRVYGTDGDGNQKIFVYGDFPNQSKYVRVEMTTDLIPVNALPMGIDNYVMPISNGTISVFPHVQFIKTQKTSLGDFNFRTYLGFDYGYTDNMFILKPVASASAAQPEDSIEFNLENCLMSNETQTAEIPFDITIDNANAKKARKFTIGLQGGFDGFDPTVDKLMGEDMVLSNVMGFDCTTAASSGVSAYKKAIDTIANPEEFDINMLVLPGITNDLAGSIISYANGICEDRQDTFFLFDCTTIGGKGTLRKTPTNAVNSVKGIDSNYAATYYPWVKIFDNVNNKYVWVPPSVVMAGVISFSDRVAAEWWAPAGLNRGGISSALQTATRLSQSERDLLYEGRVNPIVQFTGQGIVAWGQKTLQVKASALDRINVRRLLIAVKKYIASTTKYLVFEQNTNATRTRFLNIVNPYLQSIQQKQGLYAFKVVMDETNNTPDIIDRNMLVGEIYLQPAKTAEMISITFNILPTGAVFSQ